MNRGTFYSPRISSFQDKNSSYVLPEGKSFFLIWNLNGFKKCFWYFSFIKYSKVCPELQQYRRIKEEQYLTTDTELQELVITKLSST